MAKFKLFQKHVKKIVPNKSRYIFILHLEQFIDNNVIHVQVPAKKVNKKLGKYTKHKPNSFIKTFIKRLKIFITFKYYKFIISLKNTIINYINSW